MEIAIQDLTVVCDGRAVLRSVTRAIPSGACLLIQGRSGCGKSTLLQCLLGFVVPTSGAIRVGDIPLDGRSVWDLRRRLAYVQQEPDLGMGTAREAVERPFQYHSNRAHRARLDQVPGLMERFGLSPDLLAKDVQSLSGGEKQRVALVAAMLLDRPILLLDEATSALDAASKQAVVDALRQRKEQTLVCVSHDPALAALADQVVDLTEGR